jgi:peptide/nickel transport system permease protein
MNSDETFTLPSKQVVKTNKKYNMFFDFIRRLVKEKPLGTVGAVIVLIFIITGCFAPWLAPYGLNETNVMERLQGTSIHHILGTDNLGRDLLSQVIYGARISMIVGLGASLIATAVSTLIGVTSGYSGGKIDLIIQRFVDAWMCFPGLVIFMSIISVVGPGLLQIILVLGISSGIGSSRLVRSTAIAIRKETYIQASQATGCTTMRTIVRHIIPNVAAPILIVFTLAVGSMIMAEATLSFLGFGVPPPEPTWGGMLSGSGRTYMIRAPGMAIWPGLALFLVIYGTNMFGDAVRDLLDPRLRGGLGRYSKSMDKTRKILKTGR